MFSPGLTRDLCYGYLTLRCLNDIQNELDINSDIAYKIESFRILPQITTFSSPSECRCSCRGPSGCLSQGRVPRSNVNVLTY